MSPTTTLFDYWRSSASYRVRIALAMAGLDHASVPVDLLAGEHKQADHLARNPQGFVPALDIDGEVLTQSLAIIEYFNETRAPGLFLPTDALGRHRVRSLSYVIAMDIHPICNPSVVNHVLSLTHGGDEDRKAWMGRFILQGLKAFERLLDHPATGRFCHGDKPTMADLCLVPQVYNAHRWEVDISGLTAINRISQNCLTLDAFSKAVPEAVKP